MVCLKVSSALACVLLPSTAFGANLLASHFSGFIYSLSLTTGNGTNDTSAGTLAITSKLQAGGGMPSWLTLDSVSGNIFVNDESEDGTPLLTALKVNADNSVELVANATGSAGQVHNSLYGVSNGTRFIALAQYDLSAISTYELPLSASSQPLQQFVFNMSGTGPVASRQDEPHPHSVTPDPTGKFIIAPDLGADLIRIFSIDAATGYLKTCPAAVASPGDGPRHGAFWISPSGATTLYVANELGNSVAAWDVTYPSAGGCLGLQQTQALSAYPQGHLAPNGSKSAEIQVAGDFVYLSNRNDQTFGTKQDSAATYSIDPATGNLTFVDLTNTYGYYPRSFSINKAGDMVAFAGQTTSTLAIVARDTATGRLGPLIAKIPVGTPGTFNQEDGLSGVVWNE